MSKTQNRFVLEWKWTPWDNVYVCHGHYVSVPDSLFCHTQSVFVTDSLLLSQKVLYFSLCLYQDLSMIFQFVQDFYPIGTNIVDPCAGNVASCVQVPRESDWALGVRLTTLLTGIRDSGTSYPPPFKLMVFYSGDLLGPSSSTIKRENVLWICMAVSRRGEVLVNGGAKSPLP